MKSNDRKSRISFFAILSLSSLCAAFPALSDDKPQSVGSSNSDRNLTAAIGAAARSSVNQVDEDNIRLIMQVDLAKALLNAGDVEDARKVITDGFVVAPKLKDENYGVTKGELVALSVKAGMADAVMPFVQSQPAESRIGLLGAYGEAQAKQGNVAGAWETAETADALLTELSKSNAAKILAPGLTVNGAMRDDAFRRIGAALVEKGDLAHAATMLDHMGNDISFYVLADKVANAEYKAGDMVALRKRLDELMQTLADPSMNDPNKFAAFNVVETLAKCGDLEHAKQMADAQKPPRRRDAFYWRIAGALIDNGDFVRARQMVDISGDDSDNLISIGKAQAEKGDFAAARKTLLDAFDAATRDKSILKADRDAMLGRVIGEQSDIGAFSDAIQSSMLLDPINRQWFLTQLMIAKEALRKDDQALQETVVAAMKAAKDSPASYAEKGYTDLAAALVKVGHKDEAKPVIAAAIDTLSQLLTVERIPQLKAIKRIQMSIGDDAGARQTEQRLAKESSELSSQKLALPNRPSADPKMAEALKLIMQSQMQDEKQMKSTLERATALLGNNAQAIEPLIFTAAMITNNMQPTTTINDQIEQRQYSEAMKTIQSTSGMRKDSYLVSLARAEATDGQVALAFETAKTIGDARPRTTALQALLPASGTALK